MSSNSRWLVLAAAACAIGAPAIAVEDLASLEVVGQRGQSLDQTRRDRYECHNWAVEQTGETPVAAPREAEPSDDTREVRRERVDRAVIGAAIGAGVGGILGGNRRRGDSGERVLAGAAVGAAIGAATAARPRDSTDEAAAPSDYLRALTACLEGRGYSVHLLTAAELTASR